MSIFYKEQKFLSEQNGELTYRRYFDGTWFVRVPQGEYYGGNYLENMWRVLPYHFVKEPPKNVLILGCGACCAVYSVLKMWPDTKVDAIDYDPVIIEIGKKHYKNFKGISPSFIIATAEAYLKSCTDCYDLVIIDLFYGNRPTSLLKDPQFLGSLRKVTRIGGLIIANLATEFGGADEDIFKSWYETFPESSPVKYRGSKLVVARLNNLPRDYYNIFQSKIYAESLKTRGFSLLGQPKSYFFVQPLILGFGIVTAMHTDSEPDLEEIKRESGLKHGLIIWSPWEKTFAPRPWRKNLLPPLHQKGNGFSVVCEKYRDKWRQTARRDLKKLLNSPVTIKTVNKDHFIDGLDQSILSRLLRKVFKTMLGRLDTASINFWIAERDGQILGGLAVLNYDHISAHMVAYMTKISKRDHIGTLLIDHWYQYALKNNIRYLNFGHIRQIGEPRAWQGYSDFKRKFIDQEIIIRNEYFRFF